MELGGMPKFIEWTALQPDEIRDRWLASEVVRDFESGRLSFDDFAPVVLKEFQIPLSVEAFRQEFQSWISGLFPKSESILRAVNVGCFESSRLINPHTLGMMVPV